MTPKELARYGARIKSCVGKQTVANPGFGMEKETFIPRDRAVIGDVVDGYSGNPDRYAFNKVQRGHFDNLSTLLKRHGMRFQYCGAMSLVSNPAYNMRKETKPVLTRFICVAEAVPGLMELGFAIIWEKYESNTAGAGQNFIHIGGQTMKLSTFLSTSCHPARQMPLDVDQLIAWHKPDVLVPVIDDPLYVEL